MSHTPPRIQRRPLQERSESQTNKVSGIRVVPYSPPRPISITSETTEYSRSLTEADRRGSHRFDIRDSQEGDDVPSPAAGKIAGSQLRHASDPASGSPSPGSPGSPISLAPAKQHRVSGAKMRSESGPPGSSTPTTPVSKDTTTASPITHDFSGISQIHAQSPDEGRSAPDDAAATARPHASRRRNFVTVNSGKGTFSLQSHARSSSALKSPSLSLSTQSSFERLSDLFSSEGRPSTPLTTLPEQDQTPSPCSPDWPNTHTAADHTGPSTTSPWNYHLVGGLRKVLDTPKAEQTSKHHPLLASPTPSAGPPPPQPAPPPALTRGAVTELSDDDSHSLLNKTSFQSSQSASTASENTNYKVFHGDSSPAAAPLAVLDTDSLRPPSSRDSSNPNYEILGRSSPVASSYAAQSPPKSAGTDVNYVLHGDPSPAPSSVAKRRLRNEYSQESLIVPPLRPAKKKSSRERFGIYKSSSRESFRRSASLTSSIRSALGQENIQAFLSTPITLKRPTGAFPIHHADSWAATPGSRPPPRSQMQAHPHQWSSQLSTVASESEGGSEQGSRSVSMLSNGARRSSGFLSDNSRRMLSISSSLAAYEDNANSRSQSVSDSLERPQPTHSRNASARLVRDQDEHGDGLADLHDVHELHQRPSRRRLASFLSSNSSERNLHSSASSRSNSLNTASLPSWARLYYGVGGGHRWLRHAASSESMMTDHSESRPGSSFRSGSPSTEHLPLPIHSPRRRPREVPEAREVRQVREAREAQRPAAVSHRASDTGSMDISPAPVSSFPLRAVLRKQTSSIWSPHLARDQRASGYSMWDPPSVSWSTESGILGRRNIQVVLFIAGFVFPFAWIAAAFLPLPPNPSDEQESPSEMTEHYRASLLDADEGELPRRVTAVDEMHYYSAKWWRNLNRLMALVGLVVIGAIIALIVVGTQEGWS